MSAAAPLQTQAAKSQPAANSPHAGLLLQRKCSCGSPTTSLTGECEECKSKKSLQTKLVIGASNDPLELEADRVADQVLAVPANPTVRGIPPCIQRFTGRATAQTDTAPASVDRVLASSGKPLETVLRQDMEQRFGHDFSRVRVHTDGAAEQSARDVKAHAYTAGHNIVFGPGRFVPEGHAGRRLLAHELAHVVQQRTIGARISRVSWGEKWDAFWGAGPIDAKRASELANEALREAERVAGEMGLPLASLHNGPPDAWRHCYWNCRMAQVIGKEDAADIARIHEEHGGNPTAERMMDDWNNEEGRSCSGDCDKCCQQKLDLGKLWVLYGGKVGASKPMPRASGAAPAGEKYEKY